MSKPEDFPQDVWNAAGLEAMKYVEWLVPVPNEYSQAEHVLTVSFARAIMAERERCAALADAFELDSPDDEAEFVNKHLGYGWDSGFDAGCTLIARAIRKGDQQ